MASAGTKGLRHPRLRFLTGRRANRNRVPGWHRETVELQQQERAHQRWFPVRDAVGGRGLYGFYEALDYTPARLPESETVAIVRAFMAHHQGMSIVAIANALLDAPMRARFHAEPAVQATELLLHDGQLRM